MNPEPWVWLVVAASWLNLVAWTYFAVLVLRIRRRRNPVPHYVTASAIVGTFAASAAGAVASLSLLGIFDPWLIRALIWACWGGLFSAGAYAIVAAIRTARRARRPGQGPDQGRTSE